MNRKIVSLIIVLLPLFLIGCGTGHVSLSGRVTYSDDGSPLEAGTVIFQPVVGADKFYARGEIGQDGKYVVATYNPKDGLPPGEYQIFVNGATRNEGNKGQFVIPLISSKYTAAETSELVLDINRSTKTFDFSVDRAPGSKK